MIALALFMTVFIMQPVWSKVNTEALQPYSAGTISQTEAMDKAMAPIRQFMFNTHARKIWVCLSPYPAQESHKRAQKCPIGS